MRTLIYVGVSVGALLVFWLSWLPSPEIGNVLPFPDWLKIWTNKNMNLRTAVPFVFLGFLAEIAVQRLPQKNLGRVLAFFILLIVVSVAEVGQIWLPKRHFDWGDIAYGIMGSAFGMSLSYCIFMATQRFRNHT